MADTRSVLIIVEHRLGDEPHPWFGMATVGGYPVFDGVGASRASLLSSATYAVGQAMVRDGE